MSARALPGSEDAVRSGGARAAAVIEAARALALSRALAWGAAVIAVLALGTRGAGIAPEGWPAAPFARWDAQHFAAIARHGYPAHGDPQWAFFPGYPLLARAAGALCGSLWVGGVLVSLACCLGAFVVVQRLAALELDPAAARRAVWLLALFPTSLFLTAFYSEALFLLVSAGAVYAARTGRWGWAAGAGFAAALTRNTGVLLVVPLACLAWDAGGRRALDRRVALALAAPVAGLGAVLAGAAVRAGHPLAPWHAQATWGRSFHGPLSAAWYGVGDGARALPHLLSAAAPGQFEPPWMKVALVAFLVLALAAVVGALRTLPLAYGAYTGAALLVPLSTPWPDHPLMSLPRFLVVLFPLPLWLAARTRDRPTYLALLAVFAAGLVVFSARFGVWAWAA